MDAGRERIAMTAVLRIENLGEAVSAGREIGENHRRTLSADDARSDHEGSIPIGWKPGRPPVTNAGRRPDLGIEPVEKTLDRRRRSFNFKRRALAGVADEAG
jgi:hypothetical protein